MPFDFGNFDLSEVMKLLQSEGPINLEVARQISDWVLSQVDGSPDTAEVAGDDTAMLGELTRTALIHVQEETGLGAGLSGTPRVLSREEWAAETLDGLRPVLTRMAEELASKHPTDSAAFGDLEAGTEADTPDLSGLLSAMAPILMGVQAGFMLGHLATRVLSRYELPLPLADEPRLSYVGPNLLAFERDWELPPEELRFFMALHETVHAAVLSVPWVHDRLLMLGLDYVAAFDIDPGTVQDRLGNVDPNDPSSFEAALGDPSEFLGSIRSAAQEEVLTRLKTTTAVLEGYADFFLERVGERLVPEFTRIREAAHRHRVERGEAAKLLEALLGFELDRDDYEQAAAFFRGVHERGGEEPLRRLWTDERLHPTPAELEAPGLWLERIEIAGDDPPQDDLNL